MEELESLEDRARAVGASITKAVSGVLDAEARCRCLRQEIYLRDLNLEFTNIELAESVTSARVNTVTLYKDWQEIKLAEITPPNRLTSFLSSTRTQDQKLRSQMDQQINNEKRASTEYYKQGEPRNRDYSINLMNMQ